MINFEQIRDMMKVVQANQPQIKLELNETPAPKQHLSKLFVSKDNKRSLHELKARLHDMGCYSTMHVKKTVAISGNVIDSSKLIGQFDYSKILCGHCSITVDRGTYKEHIEYGMIMITPSGMGTPTALTCSKCGTNYIEELKKL